MFVKFLTICTVRKIFNRARYVHVQDKKLTQTWPLFFVFSNSSRYILTLPASSLRKERGLCRGGRHWKMQVYSTIYWEPIHGRLRSGMYREPRLRQSSCVFQSAL